MSYDKVPNIITGKDLDYLSDMFNWNYGGYKFTYLMKENISNDVFIDIIEKCLNTFDKNITDILSIINMEDENE